MTMKLSRRSIILGLVLIAATAVLVVLDLWTKKLAEANLPGRGTIPLLGDFAVLVFADNRGGFLSLGAGLPESLRRILLIVLPLVAIPLVVWALLSRGIGGSKAEGSEERVGPAEYLAAVLVAAGGIGNLVDRIFRGEVRDFLNFGIGRLRTGIMNVADLYIFFAIVSIASALIYRSLRAKHGIGPDAGAEAAAGAGSDADAKSAEPGAGGSP